MSVAGTPIHTEHASRREATRLIDVDLQRWTRLRHVGVSDTDRHYAIAIHLSPYAWVIGIGPLALLFPLILWLIRKDASVFTDDHGRELINFSLSLLLLHLVLLITLIGVLLMPVLWIVAIVSTIRGAIAAGNGEYFRYPVTFRFL